MEATKHQIHTDDWKNLRNISKSTSPNGANGNSNSNSNGIESTVIVSINLPIEFISLCNTIRSELLNILGQYGSMVIRNTYGVDYTNVKSGFGSNNGDLSGSSDVHLSSDVDIHTDEWETYIYNKQSEYIYWDNINIAKELYREDTIATFSGDLIQVRFVEYIELLNLLILKLNSGIFQALQVSKNTNSNTNSNTNTNLTPSYFYYICSDYDVSDINTGISVNNGSPTPLSPEETNLLNSVTRSPHH